MTWPKTLGLLSCAVFRKEGHWKRECSFCPHGGWQGRGLSPQTPSDKHLLTARTDKGCQGPGAPGKIQITLEESQLTLDTGSKAVDFLLDTEATYLVLNTRPSKLITKKCNIMGVSGNSESKQFIEPLNCKLDRRELVTGFCTS